MSVNLSSAAPVADIDTSNSSPLSTRHDASSSVGSAPTARSRHAFNHMAGTRNHPPTRQSDGHRPQRPSDQTGPLTRSGRQSSDGLLQIPSDTVAPRPPGATAVWDWDTDLNLADDSTHHHHHHHYEPQGELLQVEQREHSLSRDEFSIPHAVAGSGVQWNVQDAADEGFVVPQLPSTTPQAPAGVKRKSTSESSGGKQPDPKRSSRPMSDTTEAGSPPADPVTAAPSAVRPQAGPAGRIRSQTDTETRTRSDFAGFAGGRPARPSGLRRTLTDPSIPMVLPARKVFPIQIGDKLFRLSGASISSDGEHLIKHHGMRPTLTLEEPRHISRNSSRSNYVRTREPTA